MVFTPNRQAEPLYDLPPCKPGQERAQTPRRALPLIEPLVKREQGMLDPKPYRILQNIRDVNACIHRNAAIDQNDALWTWGVTHMELGPEGSYTYEKPQPVDYVPKRRMEQVAMVSVGAWHTMCVTRDHRLWGWGDNQYGQLGLGNFQFKEEPVLIMDGVRRVFANDCQTFVIKEDRSLWGWGDNSRGLFGPTSNERLFLSPHRCNTPVRLMDSVIDIIAVEGTVLVIKADHTLWGWGDNHHGVIFAEDRRQCGLTPLMEGVRRISAPLGEAFFYYCFAVTDDNDLYVFGDSGYDPGTMIPYKNSRTIGRMPVKLLRQVAGIRAGHRFSMVRLTDNRLFTAGDNETGQLGNGRSTAPCRKPAFIMPGVIEIAAGHYHAMALQETGDLWIWGGDYGISQSRRNAR